MARHWDPETGAWWVRAEEECESCHGRGAVCRTRLDPDGYMCESCHGTGAVHVEEYDYTAAPPSAAEHAEAVAVLVHELGECLTYSMEPEARRRLEDRIRALKGQVAA